MDKRHVLPTARIATLKWIKNRQVFTTGRKREISKSQLDKMKEEVGFRCELCGSWRGLDVHHIVPVVCGGSDSRDNLIVVCSGCHGKLTPKSELTKIGLEKARTKDYNARQAEKIYRRCEDILEAENELTVLDVYDVIDEVLMEGGAP